MLTTGESPSEPSSRATCTSGGTAAESDRVLVLLITGTVFNVVLAPWSPSPNLVTCRSLSTQHVNRPQAHFRCEALQHVLCWTPGTAGPQILGSAAASVVDAWHSKQFLCRCNAVRWTRMMHTVRVHTWH